MMKMREVPRDNHWGEDPKGENFEPAPGMSTGQVLETSPSETELVIVSLLMRLYDLNLAILNHLDENRANEIYEAHEKGEHFNPPVFIPDVSDETSD